MFLFQALEWYSEVMVQHAEKLWELFSVDMEAVMMRQQPDTWHSFPLFQIINDFLLSTRKHTQPPLFVYAYTQE